MDTKLTPSALRDQMPPWFRGSKIADTMVAEAETTLLDERREHASRIKLLRQEEGKAMPPLEKATADALAKVREAEQVLKAAIDGHTGAYQAEVGRRNSIHSAIAQHELALRQSASPLLEAFRSELLDMLQAHRNTPVAQHQTESSNALTGRVTRKYFSSSPSMTRRLHAILAAIQGCDALKLEVLSEADLTKRIQKTLAELPEILVEEVTLH